MGLLSGKYSSPNDLAPSDVRRNTPWWTFFDDDRMAEWLKACRIDIVALQPRARPAIGTLWRIYHAEEYARCPAGCP